MEERSGYRNGHLIYPISILDHKPKGGGGDVASLEDLDDVSLNQPVAGQVLKYNGSIWENKNDDGSIPAPDSVGTEQIIDGSILTEDLNPEISNKLTDVYNKDNETLYINGSRPV